MDGVFRIAVPKVILDEPQIVAAIGEVEAGLGPDTRAPVEDVSSERPVEGPHEPIRP
jgi:hypothetical protein